MTVEGVLQKGPKGPAIEVPFDPADELGAAEIVLEPGQPGYRVEVLMNGVRFRSAIVRRGGRFYLLVDESLARRAGVAAGSEARVSVWCDAPVEGFTSPAARKKTRR